MTYEPTEEDVERAANIIARSRSRITNPARIASSDDYDLARILLQNHHRALAERSLIVMHETAVAVVNEACRVIAADSYVHPVLSREDAVKMGVDGLCAAVRRYQGTQQAKAKAPEPKS